MELKTQDKAVLDELIEANKSAAQINEYHVTDISEFNHLDMGFYKKKTHEATDAGFDWLFDLESPTIDSINNTRTAIRIMSPKDRLCTFAIFHLKMNWFLRLVALVFRAGPLKVVEFETQFSDDSFVVTSTSKSQNNICKPAEIINHHVKSQPFDALYALHQQHVEQHLADSSERSVISLDSLNAIIQAQQTMDKHKLKHMHAKNYLGENQVPKILRNDPEALKAAMAYAQSKNPTSQKAYQDHKSSLEERLKASGKGVNEVVVIPIEGFAQSGFAVPMKLSDAVKDRQT